MRNPIFVPGNRANMLEKALTFECQWVVPDLEDSVPDGQKSAARDLVSQFAPKLAAAGFSVMVRVNSLDTGLTAQDLRAVVALSVAAVSVGKVSSVADIKNYDSLLSEAERDAGVEKGSTRIVPWIENAAAVQHAYEIATESPRVTAVAFGGEDYTASAGIPRTQEGEELRYPRSAVAVAALAAGVIPLDTPYVDFRDIEGLVRECESVRRLGFKGKFAIHPGQVAPIGKVFSPAADEIAYAKRVVREWDEAQAQGRGSFALDGKMVDVPIVKRARRTLADAGLTN